MHQACPDASVTAPSSDWSYTAEGGASMVFAYVGPPHAIFDGTVLRLRKSPRPKSESLQLNQSASHDHKEDEPDDASIAFQDAVLSRLVPQEFLPRLRSVKVTTPWLQELSAVARVHRPIERIKKDDIDISRGKGVLATDLVGRKGLAVEIKPKWGFLPNTTYLSPITHPLKTRHCRYCMHAHLKSKNGTSVARNYCPLDLFSGNQTRVKKALVSLWQGWFDSQGAVNNLRIFHDGKVIHPGSSTSLRRLGDFFEETTKLPRLDLQLQFIDSILPLLMKKPLLSTISSLQRNFDSLDIEGLSQLWSKFHPDVHLGHGIPEPTLEEWTKFVDAYHSAMAAKDGAENLRYHILAYLLSATFKDCSIILRLEHGGADDAGRFENTVSVIDLDPKSPSRLAGWKALDEEIMKNFVDVTATREACIDQPLKI